MYRFSSKTIFANLHFDLTKTFRSVITCIIPTKLKINPDAKLFNQDDIVRMFIYTTEQHDDTSLSAESLNRM